ncbi:hypothetical protein BJ742DRAFT_766890 [Cladochytrium replicatum]|nr:hypothetical protein BJ742DRAFT_766890 [Cladochytrium replicatum]
MSSVNFVPCKNFDPSELEGTTLLMPAPNSIANLSQLAIDILLTTLRVERVGFIDCPYIIPVCGLESPRELGKERILHTAAEAYQTIEGTKFTILQIRAPVAKGKGAPFVRDLSKWCASAKFSDVVVATGADASLRDDRQLTSDPLRVMWARSLFPERQKRVDAMANPIPELETFANRMFRSSRNGLPPTSLPPGTGLSRIIDYVWKQDESLPPLAFLLYFTTEGENMIQAQQKADALDQLIGFSPEQAIGKRQWMLPTIWGMDAYESFDREIY